jgi:catechol 2,3-dioxygenase-like lactoylglutathione lyase family enzyme
MAHRFHHAHIKSKDPRAGSQWWADMFGATALPEMEFGDMLFCPVELDGVRINITTMGPGDEGRIADPPEVPHFGLEHLGLVTPDLDAVLARFEEQGLPILGRREGAGGYEIAFVITPDGVCLELLQEPETP